MDIRLSICIPVYNCGEFIGEALESILPQTKEGIEVVVFDGGSTDGTPALMENYLQAWPNLSYHRANSRGGIDADMAACIKIAQGEYCWLFSGDDVMRPNAIERALELISSGHDVYICKHTICDKRMRVSHDHPVLRPDCSYTANLSIPSERLEWFRRAETTEAFFSFMSGLIVRRGKWESGELPDEFSKSCWGHVARLFGLLSSGLKVTYVAEIWLDQRGDNDSFADKGVVNRYRIAIEGYHLLADHFFGGGSPEAFHIRRVIRNEFTLKSFLLAKAQCKKKPEIESSLLLDRLVRMACCDNSVGNYLTKVGYSIFPYWLFVAIRYSYRALKLFYKRVKHAWL